MHLGQESGDGSAGGNGEDLVLGSLHGRNLSRDECETIGRTLGEYPC